MITGCTSITEEALLLKEGWDVETAPSWKSPIWRIKNARLRMAAHALAAGQARLCGTDAILFDGQEVPIPFRTL